MADKYKEAMDILYTMAKEQADRYRKLDAEVTNCYFEFSHELFGVTTAATYCCESDTDSSEILEYAAELRNKFWEEEVRGVQ